MNIFRLVRGRFLIGALFAIAAAQSSAQDAVARLGQMELTSAEVQRLWASMPSDARQKVAGSPENLQRMLRNELIGKVLLAEARAKGWDRRPEVVAQMERVRDRALVAAYMRSLVMPPPDYPKAHEIESFYESNKASFTAPTQYHLAQIFMASGEAGDQQARAGDRLKKVMDLSAKLQRPGANFEKLARERSEHRETAQKGGDAGWFTEQSMLPEIRRQVMSMQKGEISPAIPTPGGWHFVRLLDVRPGASRSLSEVRPNIIATLRARKAKEMETAQVEGLLKKSSLTINQAALERTIGNMR